MADVVSVVISVGCTSREPGLNIKKFASLPPNRKNAGRRALMAFFSFCDVKSRALNRCLAW